MSYLNPRVLDLGLNVLDAEATDIYICNTEPTTYAQAIGSAALGNKTFSAGGAFGAPANATPDGRKVTSTAILDGSVTVSGTASHYAVVDSAASRLLATNALDTPQAVVAGNNFTLPGFDVRIPAAV